MEPKSDRDFLWHAACVLVVIATALTAHAYGFF
jgi:hypothetical protein